MQKCQKCPNPATLHVTELLGANQYEELHLCEQCASKYLYEPQPKFGAAKGAVEGREEEGLFAQHECPSCGIKFVDFRNSGRLGCPNDYQTFREELLPLLENIHGEVRHCGKVPRRHPQSKEMETELIQLRNRLKHAVTKEDYEEAAKLRDLIKHKEEA
ncbi:MAG: UvrB/UvrC motif-containing protein [Gemmataceae bacterium]|nr:UvrB/UvrC motif-containing protein [Gemmataceae bacterium]